MSNADGKNSGRPDVATFVATRVSRLQEDYLADRRGAVAELAKLRKGVVMLLGSDAELVGLTVANLEPDLDGRLVGPTIREFAAYTAITLFALHQQSKRTKQMHEAGVSFGQACRQLSRISGADDAVRRRFNALSTAADIDEFTVHARGLVGQFRSCEIPLDYGRVAADLVRLQFPESADRVRLAWARDFYRIVPSESANETPANSNE